MHLEGGFAAKVHFFCCISIVCHFDFIFIYLGSVYKSGNKCFLFVFRLGSGVFCRKNDVLFVVAEAATEDVETAEVLRALLVVHGERQSVVLVKFQVPEVHFAYGGVVYCRTRACHRNVDKCAVLRVFVCLPVGV